MGGRAFGGGELGGAAHDMGGGAGETSIQSYHGAGGAGEGVDFTDVFDTLRA
jgi:hypothetical protein